MPLVITRWRQRSGQHPQKFLVNRNARYRPFYVLDLDAVRDRDGNLDRVTAISVYCNHCKHITHAKAPVLETMQGGTLLACAGCGERQAVSNARLVECGHVLGHTLPLAMPA
ncbi:hypothetical protein [Stenotrophomonas maltophilia]|uniref:hypothetical protein n=1 Tax=Stenotrophomonas maltophilia TaxID=40324 RepID=UPI000A499F3B|nr:hypothetical protein [Stenotrophomonas maltophilia]